MTMRYKEKCPVYIFLYSNSTHYMNIALSHVGVSKTVLLITTISIVTKLTNKMVTQYKKKSLVSIDINF